VRISIKYEKDIQHDSDNEQGKEEGKILYE
jgi:hypothetical protein